MRLLKLVLALCMALWFAPPVLAASVDGLAIRSTVQGTGPTIIFVHGWTCDESSWDSQVPAFMHDYRVVTLDLPGHGKSDSPAQAAFSMDLFAAAVEAVRKEIGADRIVLVGHSMGAVVIRQYALNYPQHVAGLVAVDGLLDVRPFAAVTGDKLPMSRDMRAAFVETMFVPATPEALRQKIRATMLNASDATAIGANKAVIDPAIQSSRIITAPALTIWDGNRTNFYPSTKELLPNWTDTQMVGTGHFPMMEQPEKFNGLLRQFLRERAKF